MRTKTITATGALSLLVLLVVASADCSSSSAGGQSSFCASVCPPWLRCLQASKLTPSSCSASSLEAACESACAEAASGLGDSEGVFLGCASCTLPYVGDEVCNESKDKSVGGVSCANSCNDSRVNPAGDAFYTAFQSDLGKAIASACPVPCSWTGTWSTHSEGTMTLTQTGNMVTGSYSSPVGTFSGTASGLTVTGTWLQASSNGPCPNGPQTMTMSADCSSFTGTYHYCNASGGSGAIDGTRQ